MSPAAIEGKPAMEVKSTEAKQKATHELFITRIFDAPRELVWRAWSDPAMASQWSGPRAFPAVHVEFDARVGGKWRICLRGCPPGTDTPVEIWQGGVYREIVPQELLVYTFAWEKRSEVGLADDGDPHETIITIRFEEHQGKTTMHFHQAFFAAVEERDGHRGGWNSAFDRLEDQIGRMQGTFVESRKLDGVPLEVNFTRVFAAPRELVWKAWTDAAILKEWWGPTNFTNPVCEIDARVGGKINIVMRGPDGQEYPMTGVFTQVKPPERLAFDSGALDEKGDQMFEITNTVNFETVEGGTEVMLHVSVNKYTPVAPKFLAGMDQGWNQSLVRLHVLLSRIA